MGPEILIMLVVLIGGLFLMNTFSKRSQKKRLDEREQMFKTDLIPGVWVQTLSGFYGRFVDIDGDVVILETPSGEETYWIKAAIRGVGEPPFEAVTDASSGDAVSDVDSMPAITTESTEVVSSGSDVDFEEFEAQFRPSDDDQVDVAQTDDASTDITKDSADSADAGK